MIEIVENFIKKYKIQNKTVVLGFSSGPDSCFMALILNELKKRYNLNLVLAYFNHGWREEAKNEEEFTVDFANKINALCEIGYAPKNVQKTEEVARELRYAFFKECAKKYDTDVVFLGHNKNDNIETLIYRIIKGTSINGLMSIPEKRDIYYRPILNIEKEDILNFLKKKKQNYSLDSSNENVKYKRNLIRKKIIPVFQEINPNTINNIEILIKNAISSKKIIDKVVKDYEKKVVKENKILREKFIKLDSSIRYEIINDFYGDKLKYRDYKTIKKIDDFILENDNSKLSINSLLFLKVKNDKIFIEEENKKNDEVLFINKTGEYQFEEYILKIEKTTKTDNIYPKEDDNSCFLNFDFPVCLRHRKNGDIFQPCGLKNGKMKLKDFLINNKIEQTLKDKLFLLCKENEVLWVFKYKISEKYKVNKNSCYKLTMKKG